ncbi:MAG: phosphoenolpyruvate carboxykinase (GTP) [Proteobacteria bacterium]|nr:phosphoenolpyruvate carboxykinase (GTP) [Pseudomonadota bacterium]MDA0994192.1 phosphoenolpyruvate carboxykinase (GTP) [Pseudomonadota bacterium]
MTTTLGALQDWVESVALLAQPDNIYWCDGSDAEYDRMIAEMCESGVLSPLNQDAFPDCYLHLSDPSDVARVEHLTFVCTTSKEDAGPNNNWMSPAAAHKKIDKLFKGAMKGRTLYVIPYCMGPIDSPYARLGVEITDSAYVVANMRLMTRMGKEPLQRIEKEGSFVRGLHSTGDLDPERRFIMHFPEELSIKSIGSGYGGNALLGKKCHALRIASYQARQEGWLAEHMLIVGVENPHGEVHYVACAFPSACGKTNLAMLIPPESHKGWRIWTLGDDIAWLHLDEGGKLRAINPEAGYFGVVPGTNEKTNKNAYEMIHHDTIFTNVATTADDEPWWEDKKSGSPAKDWQGRIYDPATGPAAHPNSRFTVSARNNPSYSSLADAPEGVPISAIVFGGRRRELAPLVYEAKDWNHGVLVGASVASETTAANVGEVGIVRRDPMAMKPFCGYNFADYWSHWLSFSDRSDRLPQIFHVNWFRQDKNGKFLWPGFGENLRVIRWIIERCEERAHAHKTPIGYLPNPADIDTSGLDMPFETMKELLAVNIDAWREEMDSVGEYLESFGDRLPEALKKEHARVVEELKKAS